MPILIRTTKTDSRRCTRQVLLYLLIAFARLATDSDSVFQCAIDNNVEILVILLDHGADVNAQDTELWSPLHVGPCEALSFLIGAFDKLSFRLLPAAPISRL